MPERVEVKVGDRLLERRWNRIGYIVVELTRITKHEYATRDIYVRPVQPDGKLSPVRSHRVLHSGIYLLPNPNIQERIDSFIKEYSDAETKLYNDWDTLEESGELKRVR